MTRNAVNNVTDFRREQYLEKPLPSSDESERVILGAILIDNAVMDQAAARLIPGDFYSPVHRRVFQAMVDLQHAGKPLDAILIGEEFKRDGNLEAIGGVPAIANLTFGLPYFSNIVEYVETVRKKARLRDLIRTCNQITAEATAEELDAEDVIIGAQTKINDLASEAIIDDGNDGFVRLDNVIRLEVRPALAALERGESRKISTGFPAIDAATGGGITTSDVMVLAGLPSSGKSALALQMAYNIAAGGVPAGFLAGEMTNKENVFRLLSQVSGFGNVNNYTRITAGEHDFLDKWTEAIKNVPLYLDHRTSDVNNLAARLRAMSKTTGIKVLVVDYIQLFKVERLDKRTRFERISEVSQELKRLANELDLAVIGVSQFNRAGAKSGSPTMFDSDGSSQIEKDASIYAIVDREDQSENVTIRIVKGRNSGTGTLQGKFIGRCVKFELD